MKVNGKEYITIKEMAKKEKTSYNTIKHRLHEKDIRPISKEALYELSAYEAIKNAKVGRPKKQPKKVKYSILL